MAALVIESFPAELHSRLQQNAAAHHRSVSQETIHLLQKALNDTDAPSPPEHYWSRRPLVPEYEAALAAGAFSGGADSTNLISAERDAR